MTAFTTLSDGGLSIRIAGVERRDVVHGLEWQSTNQGDGAASFWMEVADSFNPQAEYPELVHGATVAVTHAIGAVVTKLYNGFVLSDPRAGYAGEKAVVTVECGGVLEVAKGRTDTGFIFTDADTSQWFPNKRSPKCHSFDNSGHVEIRVSDDTKIKHDVAGILGCVAYNGATHMLGIMNGWKRITGTVSWNLKDRLNAALIWAPAYKSSLNATGAGSPYTNIHTWISALPGSSTNTHADTGENKPFDYIFAGADGAGYVALALWSNKVGGTKTTNERFIRLEDSVLYTDVAQKTVDQGMLKIAQIIGLAPGGYDVQTIGNVMSSLVVRPYTDPSSALAALAAQADRLVEWGWFSEVFRAKPMLTNPLTIRALPNCYLVDAESPDVVWDVTQHPESGIARSLRLIYGHTGKTIWPPGSPAQVVAPSDPGWAVGTPFMGATSPVMTVDFSQYNYTAAHAASVAKSLASHLGVALSGGEAKLTGPTIPVYGGGTRPVPYIHGGDWIESQQGNPWPLYITRAHVSADTGYVDLDVGLSEDLLIDQLQAAGGTAAVKLHKPHRRRR